MILNPFLIKDSVLQSMQSILQLFSAGSGELEDLEKLEIGWTWILSVTEQKLNENEKESKEELINLRRLTNNISLRPQIIQTMLSNLNKLELEVRKALTESRLDSNNRLKLLKEYTEQVNKGWLTTMLAIINYANTSKRIGSGAEAKTISDKLIKNSWDEKKYEKNICGEIISLAHQASHSTEINGLTYRLMGDIFWIIYISLSKVLVQTLNRPLYVMESNVLLDTIIGSVDIFIKSWLNITKIKGNIKQREGRLPVKWNQEVLKESQRIEAIKIKGTDAKFLDGPSDKLRQSSYFRFFPTASANDQTFEKLVKTEDFKTRSMLLSSFLAKKGPKTPDPVSHIKRKPNESFLLASALLSQRFCTGSAP